MPVWDPKANDLLSQALECASEAEQGLLLDKACGADTDLRHRVEQLLLAYREVGSFLEQPAAEVLTTSGFGRTDEATIDDQAEPTALDFLGPCDKPGRIGTLGPYEVFEVIGRGGMGIVLRRHDAKLNRVVAIKVMIPELAANPSAVRRFLREAQAAAAISHNHVVTIHAVDDKQRLPFLVMEFIDGQSLQTKIDHDGALGLKEILRIGMQVASGLAAAHKQGLIHRDVKPANILLENSVERVKITDFGLARAVDDACITQAGLVTGTPQYMSPEQARGEPVDHRADLFSLGSVLYAMCVGSPPFLASTTMGVLRGVSDDTPRSIKELNPEIPDWLVNIVDKLLAKDPDERFRSAEEVADLLGQYLAHLQQPSAVPMPESLPSPRGGKVWPARSRLSRRHRLVAAAVLFLLVGSLGLTEATGVTRVAEFVGTVLRITTPAGTLIVEVDDPQVQVTIEGDGGVNITGAGPQEVRLRPGNYRLLATKDGKPIKSEVVTIARGGKEVVNVSLEAAGSPLAPDEIRSFAPYWGPVTCVAVSPDGRRGLFGGEDTIVWLVDLAGKDKPRPFEGHTKQVLSVAFSPDRRRALSGGQDATVRLWDVQSGKELRQFDGHTEIVWKVAFSPDGRVAASGGGGQFKDGKFLAPKDTDVRLWDVETGKELRRLTGHKGYVISIAFSPDGKHLLTGCSNEDPIIRLWDVASGNELGRLEGHIIGVHRLVFSADGRRALSAGADRTIRLWDVETRKTIGRFLGHASDVTGVAFSPDNRYFVSCSWDKTIRLWDVESGKELHRFEGHTWSIRDVAFSPDGKSILSGAEDGTVRLWKLPAAYTPSAPREVHRFEGHTGTIRSMALSPDGRRILSGGDDATLRLWDVETGREIRQFTNGHQIATVVFSADGHRALTSGWASDDTARLWDVESGKELRRFKHSQHDLFGAALSPDGRRALSSGNDNTLRLWDVESGNELLRFDYNERFAIRSVAFSPDGRYAVSGALDATSSSAVRLWDVENGKEVRRFSGHTSWIAIVAFSPDGQRVLSGSYDKTVRLWDVASGNELLRLEHGDKVDAVAFSPDGRRALSGAFDGTLHLWDLETGTQLLQFQAHAGAVKAVAFSPGGHEVVSAGEDATVRLWQLPDHIADDTSKAASRGSPAIAISPNTNSGSKTKETGEVSNK